MPICRIYTPSGRELVHFVPDDIDADVVTVGRSSSCTIPLKSVEPTISREHFLLKPAAGTWKIVDTSKGGIFRQCEKISEALLGQGDIIRFGQYFFAFGEKAIPSDFELMWTDPDTNMPARAVLWNGLNNIGSSRDNSVCIKDHHLSRFHGFLNVKNGSVTYSNKNEMTTAEINGVEAEDETPLHDGDVITFNGFEVKVIQTQRSSSVSALVVDDGRKHNYRLKSHRFRKDAPTLLMLGCVSFFIIAILVILYLVMAK